MVSILLRGEVPDEVSVCGASNMALRKPNGTLRPIAVGETIRRLTSKVAVELITDPYALQLGVKTPNGCEAIVHTARQWLHRHRSDVNKVAVSVDIFNAFNSVYRSAVLRTLRVHFLSLTPWVDCCYRPDSVFFSGSSAAAPQGGSSSREFSRATRLAPAVQHFLSALVRGFRRIGLVVNLDKIEVIPTYPSSKSFAPGDFQSCAWIGSSNFKLLGRSSWVVGVV